MVTANDIHPLAYPDGWPKPPSTLEIIGRWIPVLGWMVSAALESRRLRPGSVAILEQLQRRAEIPEEVWPDAHRADVAKRIIQCCTAACCWDHPRFAPRDPFEIIIQWQTGDLCELEAVMNIEDAFSLKMDDNTVQTLLRMTLLEVVDYVIDHSSGAAI
jgi:hypothetical protein